MAREFSGSKEDIHLVNEIAETIYPKIALSHAVKPEVVHARGVCTRATTFFLFEASEHFSGVQIYERWTPYPKVYHRYNRAGEGWVIDLVWQQIIYDQPVQPDDINHNLPKVLIARAENLTETLSNLGVPQRAHHFWTRAKRIR